MGLYPQAYASAVGESVPAAPQPDKKEALPEPAQVEHWDTEFKTYFRGGMAEGMSPNRQLKLPGAKSKYRLGNEFDQYGELLLRQDLAHLSDGSIVSMGTGAKVDYPYDTTHYDRKNDENPQLAEAYLLWRNIPWLGGGTLTAGQRLYLKDSTIHINNFTYEDFSGIGVGVEDVKIGPVKATWILSRKDDPDQEDYITRNNLLIEGFEVNPDGFLEFGFTQISKDKDVPGSNSGWSSMLRHRQIFPDDAQNLFVIQYGEGPGTNLGLTGNPLLNRDNKSWRLLDSYEWQNGRFGGQVLGLWQRDRFSEGNGQDWWSIGGRATYGITDYLKLALEVGHDQVKPTDGDSRSMTKLTIAPILSPAGSGFWQRPEIRLFYTYGFWNEAAQQAAGRLNPGAALSDTGAFGTSRHGGTFGIQVEYWNDYTPVKTALKNMGW
ncbi:hypothetical protein AXK11_02220 [Cephaloticoccus primus]|uniref:Alginate export domain-containing protein n=1 Tax=Cephaloticoccus primus TaxID=1548207 RepID=A0A139SSF4_9BACT|nr:carbohydrate porin [Cephaloticoccus primus]KXU37529.1 hypothetical protein AXK11_02220 [Cephaloticoccus primus]